MLRGKYRVGVDQFEQKVVLRVSRTIYLAFAGVATLSLVAAVLIVLYGLTPTVRGSDPPEPAPPTLQAVSPAEVLATLEQSSGEDVVIERWTPEEDLRSAIREGAASEDPTAARLEELLTEIGTFFDMTKFPWLSETRSVCSSKNWYGECIRWEKRVTKRGVLTLLDRGTQGLTPTQRVEFLDGVLAVLKMVDEEETRFLAVQALADMKAAYGRPAGASLSALKALFDRDAAKRTPLVEQQKAQVLSVILQIRKRDTPESTLATLLPMVPRFCSLFSPDDAVSALDQIWILIGGFPSAELVQRLVELDAALDAAPADLRVKAVVAFGDVLSDKNLAARRIYESALGERRQKIGELESRYSDRKERKSGARTMGVTGILSGLATIAVIGLFLGLLAVERNTRLLRDVIERIPIVEGSGTGGAVAPEAVQVAEEGAGPVGDDEAEEAKVGLA